MARMVPFTPSWKRPRDSQNCRTNGCLITETAPSLAGDLGLANSQDSNKEPAVPSAADDGCPRNRTSGYGSRSESRPAAFQRTYEKFEDISDDEFEETYRVNVFAIGQ
jgi:hypothetical protein